MSMKVKVYDKNANVVGSMQLKSEVFEREYNESLIHQVVVAQLANKRQGTKSTLTRSEVRGGGAKPWRQKGTGRARQGSIRSPQWIKGGVVFAPKPRDFSQKINKKMKKAALVSALSKKLADGDILVIDSFAIEEAKTKNIAAILKAFGFDKKTLFVLENDDENVLRASKNIEELTTLNVDSINVYDLVCNAKCVISKEAIKKIQEVYA